MNREKQTAITRLRFGKSLLGDVLHTLGKQNDNLCEFCHTKEDVQHFLRDCRKYNDFIVNMNDKLIEADVVPSLESLLGSSRWFDEVWSYVCKTKRFS